MQEIHPSLGTGQLKMDFSGDVVVRFDLHGVIQDWNDGAEVLFGWEPHEAIGKLFSDLVVPPVFQEAWAEAMTFLLMPEKGSILNKRFELSGLHRTGSEFSLEVILTSSLFKDSTTICAFLRDTTEIKVIENRLQLQYNLAQVLAEGGELEVTVQNYLKTLLDSTDWEAATLWIPSPDNKKLIVVGSIHEPDSEASEALTEFIQKNNEQNLGPGEGASGQVWDTRNPIWNFNPSSDENLSQESHLFNTNVKTMVAYPLLSANRCVGVLELFSFQKIIPDTGAINDLLACANQMGQFLERKQLERNFVQQQNDLKDYVDNATVGMHWVGPDGIIKWANKFELNMLGYSAEEYIGHPISEFHVDDHVIKDILFRLKSNEALNNYEAKLRCKDGSIRHALINSNVRWDNKTFVHTRCFTRDITERKAAEENLIASEKRFRLIADAAPVFIWVAGTDRLFNYLNKPWLEFRGRSIEQEQGNGWMDGIHPDDLKKCVDHYLAAFEKQVPFRLEFRLKRFDGIFRWILDTGTPTFSEAGIFSGYVGSCIDITDLKFTEEQLRHSQKMETIGRLAGGVAHDFNNLLTAINGFSELALGLVKEEGSLREFLQEIKKSGEQAAILTQQLLAYSRKQILTPSLINLNLTVLEMDRMLKRVIREDIELNTILEPNLGLVEADGAQLQQIILNLIINARDAMPTGGRLLLETSNVFLNENYVNTHFESKPGPHILLAISDNGIGMDAETKARIFEPFFTTKEIGKGTGLGLASVYGIIKQSGGSILVYSEPGQGTSFKIYLPSVTSEKIMTPEKVDIIEKNLRGSETILVVEDDATVRKFIHQTLSDFGYTVLNAKDGAEALIALKRKVSIDLVLTDVIMPGINGRQLANEVLAMSPDMKILFMSGYTENAIVHNGILDMNVVFLQKPFGQSELVKMIRGVFDKASKQNSSG